MSQHIKAFAAMDKAVATWEETDRIPNYGPISDDDIRKIYAFILHEHLWRKICDEIRSKSSGEIFYLPEHVQFQTEAFEEAVGVESPEDDYNCSDFISECPPEIIVLYAMTLTGTGNVKELLAHIAKANEKLLQFAQGFEASNFWLNP